MRGFDKVPSVLVERFPGDGHWIMWDDVDGFAARIRSFEASI